MYLYGASGHAKVIIDILENNNTTIDALYDDNDSIKDLFSYPVLSTKEIIKSPLIISIGNNVIRKKIVDKLHEAVFGTAFHSSSIISKRSKIDIGTVVMQSVIIQSEVRIGKHCIINTAASIDHNCKIGDFVHISPQATLCGNVEVGEGTWIGAGTIITPGVKIGNWTVIGAGSVVTRDIPDHVLAVGNRCKIIKFNYEQR